jgi:hypothetical protein
LIYSLATAAVAGGLTFVVLIALSPPDSLDIDRAGVHIRHVRLAGAVVACVVTGLWFGGLFIVRHLALQCLLALSNSIPFRVSAFLDYSVRLRFLQRAGDGYMFIRRLVLEHFRKTRLG